MKTAPNTLSLALAAQLSLIPLIYVWSSATSASPTMATVAFTLTPLVFVLAGATSLLGGKLGGRLEAPASLYMGLMLMGLVSLAVSRPQNFAYAVTGAAVDVSAFFAFASLAGRGQAVDVRFVRNVFLAAMGLLTVFVVATADHRSIDFILHQKVLHRNAYGSLLGTGVVLSLVCYLRRSGPIDLAILGASLLGVLLSFSKTTWMAIIVLLLAALLFRFSFRRLLVVVGVVGVGAFLATQSGTLMRALTMFGAEYVRNGRISTFTNRTYIWEWAHDKLAASQWSQLFGFGYDSASNFDMGQLGRIYSLHSDFWNAYYSFGIVGLVILAAIWLVYIGRVLRAWQSPEAILPFIVGAYVLARGFTETSYGASVPNHTLFWVGITAASALYAGRKSQAAQPSQPGRNPRLPTNLAGVGAYRR